MIARTRLALLIVGLALASSTIAYSQQSALGAFFSPLEQPTTPPAPGEKKTDQKWRPVVAIPALKIVESTRDNAQLDALILTQVGGGVSYQYLVYDTADKKWRCSFSWSPMTVLIAGNTAKDDPIDISYATTVGFFDNLIMAGVGWDFGAVDDDRSRFFGLLSIGINFNN